jgi:hypothetical protein
MATPHPATQAWAEWWLLLDDLDANLRHGKSVLVGAIVTREMANSAVQHYFRQVRPHLVTLGIHEAQIDEMDYAMQTLIKLSARANRRSSYKTPLRDVYRIRPQVETALEIACANVPAKRTSSISTTEEQILSTLEQLIPSSALSYRQALQDLSDGKRVSYRGTAAEIREVVREVLDHLAPDEEVLKMVKLEKDRNKPTMKQKATFILKARGVGESGRKTAEDAASAIEDSVSSLARSVYTRGSVSTHVANTQAEVRTFKGYADAILAELLQIHRPQAANSAPSGKA